MSKDILDELSVAYSFLRDPWIGKGIDEIARLRRLLEGRWQPIESAPTDGRNVLIFNEDGIEIGWWSRATSEWCRQDMYLSTSRPTHWMPLPEPPKQEQSE